MVYYETQGFLLILNNGVITFQDYRNLGIKPLWIPLICEELVSI
jgi:hypothetical protein